MNHRDLRFLRIRSVYQADIHRNRCLRLDLLPVRPNFNVKEPSISYSVANNPQLFRGIGQIGFVCLFFRQDLPDLQFSPVRDAGFRFVIQRDFKGFAIIGGVCGFKGIDQDILGGAFRSKGKSGNGFQAVFGGLAVQLQAVGDVGNFPILDLVQSEILAGQILFQVDRDFKAFVFFFVDVFQADVDNLIAALLSRHIMQFLNGSNGFLALCFRQGLGSDRGFFRQVQIVHRGDHGVLVFRSDLRGALGGGSDVVFSAVRHADGNGVRLLAFLHGAECPVAVRFLQGDGFLVGNTDGIDIRHERFHILIRGDGQFGNHL